MARGKQKDRYIVTSRHPEDLASGRVIAPGENVNSGDLDIDSDESRDKRLIEEGLLTKMEEPKQSAPAKAEAANDTDGGDS